MTDLSSSIASALQIPAKNVSAAVALLEEGNTIPFLARYRKEATGGLDEVQLRDIKEELARLQALESRRDTILNTIRGQDKLTPELEQELRQASSRTALEDLYQPYKPKRKTRASAARAHGLTELAQMILAQETGVHSLDEAAAPFLSEDISDIPSALQGARDIAAEVISDHPEVRQEVRTQALRAASLESKKKSGTRDPRGTYQTYHHFSAQVNQLQPHQILALNRGEEEGVLSISLAVPERLWRSAVKARFPLDPASPFAPQLKQALEEGAQRLLLPAIHRDIRRRLSEKAEAEAIEVFARNLRALLLQPPLSGHTVLGLDPGFRTGCKAAVVDPTGKPLATATIYPAPPRSQIENAAEKLKHLIQTHGVTLIAIGNGTASRETEGFVSDLLTDRDDLHYLIVSEAGASVYSASPLAGEELPEMDVSLRGAVSIARRVQDPLAELVKINPQSLGVGMYQHDVNQSQLEKKLDDVVESVVHHIGVDLNTASRALLTHIAGIGPSLAARIVDHRDHEGPFPNRHSLLNVSGVGQKTFQQAAGFLRVLDSTEPLDATAIHPESYPAARQVLARAGIQVDDPPEKKIRALKELSQSISPSQLSQELETGVPTLKDIFQQLARPGRDPRNDLPQPILRQDILTMDDLSPGLELSGTVRNVVAFGAFLDIGVKQDGLLHRSQIPPGVGLKPGEIRQVRILSVDQDRGRIGLGWTGEA